MFYATNIFYIRSPGSLSQDLVLVIPNGTSKNKILEILNKNKVIKFPYLFLSYSYLLGKKNFIAGEYLFEKNISPLNTLELLTCGKVIIHKFTVPEGTNNQAIINNLLSNPLLVGNI